MKAVFSILFICFAGISAKSCLDEVKELEGKRPLLGAFKPVCQPDGTYAETQCFEGYCYCVMPESGEEILGTKLRFKRPKSCKATTCLLQRHKVLKQPKMVGAFTPQCEEDGSFSPVQCHGSTGYCFCVFPKTGEKVLGTELRFKHPKSCELTDCRKERHDALKKGLLGSYRPKCTEDGKYEPVQCHERSCFCVFTDTGKEIKGTRLLGAQPKSCEVTPCLLQRHKVLDAPRRLLGAFKPECKEDGTYEDVQCHEGYCFCVFPNNGEELLGTRVRFTKPKSCKLTPCVLSRHQGWKLATRGLLGVPISRCDPYGKYAKVQCHKGLCWCVNPDTGKAIEGKSGTWTVPKCD